MQRVCSKCNTLVTSDGAFCPCCGEPLPSAVDISKQPAGQSVQFSGNNMNANTDPHQGTMPNYGTTSTAYGNPTQTTYGSTTQYATPVNNQEMTLGQWVGTIICTTWFGLISLILSIVWAVSDNTPIAKKRYCQAMIIIQAIGIVLSIIYMIIMFSILGSIIPQMADELERAFSSAGGTVRF